MLNNRKNARVPAWVFSVVFWLAVWQITASVIGHAVLIATPLEVASQLVALIQTPDFWRSLTTSFSHIMLGFCSALVAGTLLAAAASRWSWVKTLLAPLMVCIKSVPVASFIILVLILVSARELSFIIAFIMVLPLIYINLLEGIQSVNAELLEMAQVFSAGALQKLRGIYLPALAPHIYAACSAALGMSWKAGVAAEVIGLPNHTIGEHLFESKIYLDTPSLFAWTLVIVLVSVVMEKLVLWLLQCGNERLRRSW